MMRARGLSPCALHVLLTRVQHGRRAVDDARRVPGVVNVRDLEVGVPLVDELAERGHTVGDAVVGHRGEARRQRGERLLRCLRTRKLLVVERDAAVEVEHRHEAPVESTFRDGDGRASLRLGRVRVERGAVDAFQRCDRVGAHSLVRLRVDLLEVRVAGTHRHEALLLQRHHLGPAADDEVLVAGHHHRRREVVGRDARAAEAVERDTARAHVVAGVERGHPTEITALLAHLRAGAPDDVVDVRGVEAVPVDERAQHGCRDVLRVQVRERALLRLADPARRAAGVDDESVGHSWSFDRGREIVPYRPPSPHSSAAPAGRQRG